MSFGYDVVVAFFNTHGQGGGDGYAVDLPCLKEHEQPAIRARVDIASKEFFPGRSCQGYEVSGVVCPVR